MASATPVMSLLRTHPISLRENLIAICKEFRIEFEQKDTRVVLQAKIDDYAQADSENERKLREDIYKKELKTAHK